MFNVFDPKGVEKGDERLKFEILQNNMGNVMMDK